MISEHPVFIPPQNENQTIWRYLDFTKLISLLDSSELYFPRADMFDDDFEGSVPIPLALKRNNWIKDMVANGNLASEYADKDILATHNKNSKQEMGVNCWHMNDYESAAMWKLYLKSDEGIAIRSTYKKLYNSLQGTTYNLNVGVVNYIDYETDMFPIDNGLYPFVHKRKSFEHERELRAIIWFKEGNNSKLLANINLSYGLSIKIDLKELIEGIYVSPFAPDWLHELVKSVTKKYNLKVSVHHSRINDSPIY